MMISVSMEIFLFNNPNAIGKAELVYLVKMEFKNNGLLS